MMFIETSDNVSIAVQTTGCGPKGVLFIHGWMTCGAVFEPLLEHLSSDLLIVVPDLRGTGGSARPASGYSIAQLADDMWRVADETGLERPIIVGHSMGGQIAQFMAASRPQDVSKLVLLCPVPASGLPLPDDAMGLFSTAAGDAEKLGTILDLACIALPPEERAKMVERAVSIGDTCLVETLHAWVAGGFSERIGAIAADTVVVATDDPFLPPAFLQDQVVDPIPNARLDVIHGAGHYVQLEAPAETAALLDAIIGR